MADSPWLDVLHKDSVSQFGEALTKRAQNALLFHTGLHSWDTACSDTGGGLDDFWYVVIGGASNVGKSQHMIHLARQGLLQGFAVVILSLEEPAFQIQRRVYSALSDKLGYYDFAYDRWDGLKARVLTASVPTGGKLIVNDELQDYRLETLIYHLDEVRDMLAARPMVVLMDHLQEIDAPSKEIVFAAADTNRALRNWAKRNRTLTFAFSQLGREAVTAGVAPRRWHLWGGTYIESNATQVVMIDHTAKRSDQTHRHLIRLWMMLDKNRVGPDMVAFPVEANLKTSVWRVADHDELHLWEPNPWEPKSRRGR